MRRGRRSSSGCSCFAHTYGRAKCIRLIPPGYYDVAKVGLDAAVREAGEIARRRAGRSEHLGRVVDPNNPDASIGTANVGQAHGQSLVATDLTPFGHHRAFLMRLFSSGVNIAGRDVKLMLECHVHAFEPCACGLNTHAPTHTHHAPTHARTHAGSRRSHSSCCCAAAPAAGKSMRAKRMMALLPEGWVAPVGLLVGQGGHERRLRQPLRPAGVLRRCVLPFRLPPARGRA